MKLQLLEAVPSSRSYSERGCPWALPIKLPDFYLGKIEWQVKYLYELQHAAAARSAGKLATPSPEMDGLIGPLPQVDEITVIAL